MVIDEALAQQLVPGCDNDESVRRIGSVDDLKTLAKVDKNREKEHRHRRIAILKHPADEPAPLSRRSISVDAHPVDGLTQALSPPRWSDHPNLITRIR